MTKLDVDMAAALVFYSYRLSAALERYEREQEALDFIRTLPMSMKSDKFIVALGDLVGLNKAKKFVTIVREHKLASVKKKDKAREYIYFKEGFVDVLKAYLKLEGIVSEGGEMKSARLHERLEELARGEEQQKLIDFDLIPDEELLA